MIRVSNCHNDYSFISVAEACKYLNIPVNTIYNKKLPCNHGGFIWEKEEIESKRHITCTRCGSIKWDTEYYKSSKQSEDPNKPTRYNQPCKKCVKSCNKQNNKEGLYDPKKHIAYI